MNTVDCIGNAPAGSTTYIQFTTSPNPQAGMNLQLSVSSRQRQLHAHHPVERRAYCPSSALRQRRIRFPLAEDQWSWPALARLLLSADTGSPVESNRVA